VPAASFYPRYFSNCQKQSLFAPPLTPWPSQPQPKCHAETARRRFRIAPGCWVISGFIVINLPFRTLSSLIVLVSATVAHAHPGHAGHHVTWDVSHPSEQGALIVLLGFAVVCAWVWAARQFPSRSLFFRRAPAERDRAGVKH